MASSSTHDSVRSPELQKQIDEVQSRLRDRIETLRPAHEANLRAAALEPGLTPPTNPEKSPQKPSRPRRRASRPRQSAPLSNSELAALPPLERHSRKCQICRHPEREAIEADFIEWRHPNQIGDTYDVGYDALYRHARATGLFELRRENVAIVVQKVLEEVEEVEAPSAFAILRAVRTLACLNGRGQWVEPPTTHVVVNATEPPAQSVNPTTSSDAPALVGSSSVSSSIEPQASSVQNSNRKICGPYEKLELDITHTKQTPQVISNRKNL
ncbi:MAG TPA: hypothetical protein VKS20_02565 [Candidatus Acidoferrales bacterium]|nr:hypothetical protein [Candidatus Acidoferrales bacterium]